MCENRQNEKNPDVLQIAHLQMDNLKPIVTIQFQFMSAKNMIF